jgi:hypothetical protein
MNNALWDMAGVDGLAVAKHLFGEEVGYLAPFQSVETTLQGKDCSVLRLCDRNFRISYPDPLHPLIAPLHSNVWCKQFDWLTSLSLSINFLPKIISQATVRPPHRLENSPNHQAIPAQISDIPLLIWQHSRQEQPVIELHLARKRIKDVTSKLWENSLSVE